MMDLENGVFLEQVEDLAAQRRWPDLRDMLTLLEPADIAAVLAELSQDRLPVLYRLLPKELAAEVFVEMEPEEQEVLIKSFSDTELREVLEELYVDDTVDLIEEMPATVVKRILRHTDPETRRSVNEILQYPEDSAGSIMTTEFVDLKRDMTVSDAIKRIRRTGSDKETINICYVTDTGRHLLGLVSIRTLVLADEEDIIEDIMETNIISAATMDDKEDVAQDLSRYDFLAMPVVDKESRLVGIVTIDDAIDVMEEEATEDFELMAAITPTDKPYLRAGVWETVKSRLPWLMLLMLSATFTGIVISSFEDSLAVCSVLIGFIPMLMGTGGNCGNQSSRDPRAEPERDRLQRSGQRGVEGEPGGPGVRGPPLLCQLCQAAGGGPLADAERGGDHPGGPGDLPDPHVHSVLRQGGGVPSAPAGGEDWSGPGGDGRPLHQHHCGRAEPADLLPVRHGPAGAVGLV